MKAERPDAADRGAVPELGWSAGIVRMFLESKLSILLVVGSILVGAVALFLTPREEDPQIVVPVVDVAVSMPGASAGEAELMAAQPLEAILAELPGVDDVYSMSRPGGTLVTVRFKVGEDRERSLTKVFTQLEANRHRVPPGVPGWQLRPVEIDDVPIVTLALHARDADERSLRDVALEVAADLHALPDVGRVDVFGGLRREILFELDPARAAALGLSPLEVARAIQGAGAASAAGEALADGRVVPVHAGPFLSTPSDVARIVVGTRPGDDGNLRAVHAEDVGRVLDATEDVAVRTRFGFGPAAASQGLDAGDLSPGETVPSVTIALAKRRGSNAVSVADAILERTEALKGRLIPDGVEVTVTRNNGETADHKVDELVKHLAIAVVTVVLLLGLSLGWREAGVVALAVPMTLALTLFADLLTGYSINRVTLFALILSLGLLVDDPIVDVENIFRHFRLGTHEPKLATLIAVDEIRPPTILATFTVIVSFLPMFFITGMMGPYMGPMAFNVPVAMLVSLLVAFTVTPWAAYHALKDRVKPGAGHEEGGEALRRIYGKLLRPLLRSRSRQLAFLGIVGLMWIGAVALAPLGLVPVKMLPFDNKNELLLVVKAPEGTSLEDTDAALAALGEALTDEPEVVSYQTFAGTASPIDFNGLVRHDFLRKGSHVGDVRIVLLPKAKRKMQSHAIALRLRAELEEVARREGVLVKIVETPPGPPVLATLVAEIRGPIGATHEELVAAAAKVKAAFEDAPSVSEVDWTVEADQERWDLVVDREKAALSGVSVQEAVATAALALGGTAAASLRTADSREPVPIALRLPETRRASADSLLALRVRGASGEMVSLGEIASIERRLQERTRHRKAQAPVVYVTAEPVGISPVTALFDLEKRANEALPEGFIAYWRGEGEWKITTEVFRDLGAAFGAALVLIWVLLVAQTGSLTVPLVIMLAIPLTMIGVFPGFFVLNALTASSVGGHANPIFFTAPAMIGLIALAGIVVRNSIILIDFVQAQRAAGLPLDEALIEAGAVRLRPILLTAGAALLGAWVIVLDPIFSGLAWSFIFGIFASTAFTLLVVPVAFHLLEGRRSSS